MQSAREITVVTTMYIFLVVTHGPFSMPVVTASCRNQSNQGLTRIPAAPSESCKSGKLDVSRNLIREVHPGDLDEYKHLAILDISYNQIVEMYPGAFRGLYDLDDLNLAGNRLGRLRGSSFWNLSVKSVSFQNSSVTSIEHDAFTGGLSKLQYLNLAYNSLYYIPRNTFQPISKSIRKIDLSHNRIENLPRQTFAQSKSIVVINLNDNNLIELHKDILYGLESLQSINLSNNPVTNITKLSNYPNNKGLTFRVSSPNLTIILCSNSCDLSILPRIVLISESNSIEKEFRRNKAGERFDTVYVKVSKGAADIVGTRGTTETSLIQAYMKPDTTLSPTTAGSHSNSFTTVSLMIVLVVGRFIVL